MDFYQDLLIGLGVGVNFLVYLQFHSVYKIDKKMRQSVNDKDLENLNYEEKRKVVAILKSIKTRSPISRRLVQIELKKYSS